MASHAARPHSPASGSAGAAATQSHSVASGTAGAAFTGQGHPYAHSHIGCKLPRGEDVQKLKDLQLIALDLQAIANSWVAQSWNWCHRHCYEIEDDLKRLTLWFACATSRMDVVSSMAEAVKIKDQCIAKDKEAKEKLYPVLEKLREDMEGARADHWRQSGSCGGFQPEPELATGGSLARSRSRSRSPVWSNILPRKIVARVVADSAISGIVSSTFRMTPSTPLGRMMAAWCECQQVAPEEVAFMRQGFEIRHNMSVGGNGLWPCPSCGEVIFVAVPRRCDEDPKQ